MFAADRLEAHLALRRAGGARVHLDAMKRVLADLVARAPAERRDVFRPHDSAQPA
jgi:hypothetical protein